MHHLLRVVRLKPLEHLRVVDGDRQCFEAEITEESDGIRLLSAIEENSELDVEVTLLAGMIKGERWDWLLQKCTELGVSRIVPLKSQRTVVRISGEKAAKKQERWQKIVEQAARQCRRSRVPQVTEPVSLNQAAAWRSEQNFVAWEDERLHSARLVSLLQPARSVTVVIGPEGGFSPSEIELLKQAGYQCCSLGRRILRAETAAVYALCACNFVLEEETADGQVD